MEWVNTLRAWNEITAKSFSLDWKWYHDGTDWELMKWYIYTVFLSFFSVYFCIFFFYYYWTIAYSHFFLWKYFFLKIWLGYIFHRIVCFYFLFAPLKKHHRCFQHCSFTTDTSLISSGLVWHMQSDSMSTMDVFS